VGAVNIIAALCHHQRRYSNFALQRENRIAVNPRAEYSHPPGGKIIARERRLKRHQGQREDENSA
jgi:hypothetical protein